MTRRKARTTASTPGDKSPGDRGDATRDDGAGECAGWHVRAGWWLLLLFVALGLLLESLHGFKIGFYLDASNETRRLMWTLAHAHGALLAVVNIVFGLTLERRGAPSSGSRVVASRCLLGASVLLPLGFFLGGVVTHAGDPGLGILLVPVGGLLLLTAIFLTARRS